MRINFKLNGVNAVIGVKAATGVNAGARPLPRSGNRPSRIKDPIEKVQLVHLCRQIGTTFDGGA